MGAESLETGVIKSYKLHSPIKIILLLLYSSKAIY